MRHDTSDIIGLLFGFSVSIVTPKGVSPIDAPLISGAVHHNECDVLIQDLVDRFE
jgi:hypothetical protein